jgi:hypothetical protein
MSVLPLKADMVELFAFVRSEVVRYAFFYWWGGRCVAPDYEP